MHNRVALKGYWNLH